jgi:hypothetical protein
VKIKRKAVLLALNAINPGRIFVLLVMILMLFSSVYAADISVSIDNDKIAPGESATLSVKVGGADNVLPITVPKIQGLSIIYAGMSYSFEMVNGRTWKGKTLSFTVTPSNEGVFTIPPLSIRADGAVLTTESVKITSSKKYSSGSVRRFGSFRMPPGMSNPFSDEEPVAPVSVNASLDIPKRSVYAGEPVIIRYMVTPNRDSDILMKGFEIIPRFEGFIQKEFTAEKKNGKATPIAGYVLIPQSAGNFVLGGERAVVASDDSFSLRRVEFEKVNVSVKELPAAGKPANFSGNVGSFELVSDIAPYSCSAFDEKRFYATVRGSGNFLGIKRPEFISTQESLKILYEDGAESYGVERETLKGEKVFNIVIIAEKEGVYSTGDLVMNYFDPSSGSYKTKTIPGISVTVSGKKNTEKTQSGADTGGKYTVIIWILGAAFAGLAFIAWVIIHDRKKYLLADKNENNAEKTVLPEIEKPESLSLEALIAIRDDSAFMREAEKYLAGADDSPEIRQLREHCMHVKYGGGASGTDLIREGLRKIKDA